MIPLFKVNMSEDAVAAAARVLRSGYVGQGDEVDAFEAEFSVISNPRPVVMTNSCTSAIHMVLTHLGIGPGDEVVTTPLTCVATNAPILAVGARPVWADVEPDTGNISVADVARKVTPRTKAVIAVDWTGRRADYLGLRQFVGVPVIQDAAHGPLIAGPRGDFTCYSFGPIKHLTSVDGGAVACGSSHIEDLRLLRWYGLDRRSRADFRCEQDIRVPGMKWHMNDVSAAIGRANLRHMYSAIQRHSENARHLWNLIDNPREIILPPWNGESNYWVFPLRVVHWEDRDPLKQHLADLGIMASQVHARNDKHYGYNFYNGPLPGLDDFDRRHLNIPCGWWLTEDDVDKIADAVNSFRG